MDLIYTDARRIDQGILSAYSFDLSFGAKENDFEIILGASEPVLESGAFVYSEGTEYGGTVDAMKASTDGDTITYTGRTWHGMLNSKIIQPDAGADYFIVSGDANAILATLIARLGLSGAFVAASGESGINISRYQFARYIAGYDGIRAMLAANKAKLRVVWRDRAVHLSAEPIADYTDSPIDGDLATLTVEKHEKKTNHLICLGKGDLAAREVIHLYADSFGRIGDVQYYFGLEEIAETYENTNAESSEALRNDGVKRLQELRDNDKADMSLHADIGIVYDIGDIVGASDVRSGVSVAAAVTQKIVKIANGTEQINYKTGGD